MSAAKEILHPRRWPNSENAAYFLFSTTAVDLLLVEVITLILLVPGWGGLLKNLLPAFFSNGLVFGIGLA